MRKSTQDRKKTSVPGGPEPSDGKRGSSRSNRVKEPDATERPDPDLLLADIQKHEAEKKHGRLKIFFGMCAGVGKTYAMLQEAHMLRAEGRDVVIGYVETHARSETHALMEGLEQIPRKTVTYRDVAVPEFDLDAVLQRRPDVALVDELAHSNAPGSRHPKRYQDVMELLDHGINVYTTLNVQHLESRAGTVGEITGASVRETVPDSVLDAAKEIELVDISPQELLKRLAEGKVYAPDSSKQAIRHFFRQSNLTALREMSLRVTAEHVDRQLQDSMRSERIPGPWKSSERLMVAVSWSPFSASLVGWTKRLAATMNASWIAVYVDTSVRLSVNQSAQLAATLRLAQELGAEVVMVSSDNAVEGMLHVAHQRHITQIVVGKSQQNHLKTFFKGGSLVDRLIRHSGTIDIYVVREDVIHEPPAGSWKLPRLSVGRQYLAAATAVAIAASVFYAATPLIHYQAVGMLLLFIVTLLSLRLGRGPVLFAAALSALLWNLLFIPPLFTFHIARTEDWLILGMYFIIAVVTGTFTTKIRRKEEAVRKREERAVALYTVSRALASADSVDAIGRIAVEQIGRFFDADVALVLRQASGREALCREAWCWSRHPESTLRLGGKEEQVVRWVAENRKPAGKFTDNLPLFPAHYQPLMTSRDTYGVVGVQFRKTQVFTLDHESLLDSFVGQIASAIEREVFHEQRHRDQMTEMSESFYKTLLNSISHEFRTPLAVISGAAGSLMDRNVVLPDHSRQALLNEIHEASARLNGLVEKLLDMSRLESGRIHPKLEWCDASDLFNALQRRYKQDLARHRTTYIFSPDLPLLYVDAGLVEQAVGNLVENAARYTPTDTKIEIKAFLSEASLVIMVQDEGPGFPPDTLPHLFDKFYRIPGTAPGGTGLGLSISKGLIESMHGGISAANLPTGGAVFTVTLPVETRPKKLDT
jgi:two-component system sensor histidine kinase KdpD